MEREEHREESWDELVARVCDGLSSAGLDLVTDFEVAAYDREVPEEFRLGSGESPGVSGILIGNTRSLWTHFIKALGQSPSLRASSNPLNDYVEEVVSGVVASLKYPIVVRFGHNGGTPVALQQLAEVAGLAHLSRSHLSVHPVYGPWISLRGALVVDHPHRVVKRAAESPCTDECDNAAFDLFEEAVLVMGSQRSHEAVREDWRRWVRVRDACEVGRAFRFSEEQVLYHYTHDSQILWNELRRVSGAVDGEG